jgi:hypothetical protein
MVKIKLTEPNVVEKLQARLGEIHKAGETSTTLRFRKEVPIFPILTQSSNEQLEIQLQAARAFGYTHVLLGDED